MPKQISRDEEIYLAPEILGRYEGGEPVAIDERNQYMRFDPREVEGKIAIYEREVKEWFLKPALQLLEQNSFNNSFIVLMVCMSYLEGVEQYKAGLSSANRSKDFFLKSVNRIYSEQFNKRHLEKLYSKSRCGLFHNGMVKSGVVFNNEYPNVFLFSSDGESIKINPTKLLGDLMNDFEGYICELKSTCANHSNDRLRVLRENFDRMFTVI